MADDQPEALPSDEQHSKPPSEAEQRATLAEKTAQASQLYARKSYEEAAEIYAQAAELQAELNGELAIENADLLYSYGRCLYHVAVSKSDVLGGKVAGEKTRGDGDTAKRGVKRKKSQDGVNGGSEQQAADGAAQNAKDAPESTNKPYFQIEGDDADWSSASEDGDEDGDAADGGDNADPEDTAADEEDDFATAYEILDVARVLLSRKLEAAQQPGEEAGSSSAAEPPPSAADIRATKEALADTHDLQSEISLESERFEAAVSDARASLALKLELYPQESNYVAEAHFKLSLALEFASVTQVKADEHDASAADRNAGVSGVDEEKREEASKHMEASIASTKMRLEKEKESLAAMSDGDDKQEKQRDVADVTSMVEEMEQRLADLRQPAFSVQGIGMDDADDAVKGLLGSILGESKATQKAAIEEATRGANDLTGLVKRKPKRPDVEAEGGAAANGNGKRTAAVMSGANGDAGTSDAKKAKVEDANED